LIFVLSCIVQRNFFIPWELSTGVKNNNNNNNCDNVYGAIIMTEVIARVQPGGRQDSDQANRLGLCVRRKLAATIHIHQISDVISLPAAFAAILWVKLLEMFFSLLYRWNTLCWQASNHTDIFITDRMLF